MPTLRGMLVAAIAALTVASAEATGPSGGPYQITRSTIASGIGAMSGGSYTVAASLGDLSRRPVGAGNMIFYPGFWSAFAGQVGVATDCLLDIDGNGQIEPLTDGLMIMRTLFGLTGTSVTNGAIGSNPTRTTWAQIQPVIDFGSLDVDLSGQTAALNDGLLVLRAMFGLTGTTVTNGAVAPGAQRSDWNTIRGYLNGSCGGSFNP